MAEKDSLHLPVTAIIPQVRQYLASGNTLIVSAPPGAGKSTLLPLELMNEPWLNGKKIVMLEPRRLAAGSIAQRMAALLGEPVGRTVGYRIRFETKVSGATRIEVVTEGVLTRMLHADNALENTGLVIFDEFHERSMHADLALALCRESQQVLRPDLRIMVMSATLDVSALANLLQAPVAESKGKLFPVEVIYTGEQDTDHLPEACALTISRAIREREGDILAFLPGQAEIKKCEIILKKNLRDVLIQPLYGQLTYAEQSAAILPDEAGRRKIVLSTSIAETSLTIEGIKVVVDSGLGRMSAFDPKTGLSGLKTVSISADSADQRAGRAGRLSPGACYRMWSAATQERMPAFRTPEILEADLTSLMLDMVQWGVRDVTRLAWLTPPPAAALEKASGLLHQLGALRDGRITHHGKQIHALPCHPRIAHMLISAASGGDLQLATDLAALLEERDPMERDGKADINLRIEELRRYRQGSSGQRRMENVERAALYYRRLFDISPSNNPADPYTAGLLLARAYPERIAAAKPAFPGQFQLANGRMAAISKDDDLAHQSWLAVARMDSRRGAGRIFLAAPLDASQLVGLAETRTMLSWDTRKGGLIASENLMIGNNVLQSKPLSSLQEEQVAAVVSEAIKNEGETLLDFSENVIQWQNRIMSLRVWNGPDNWPEVSTTALLEHNHDWLGPFLGGVRRTEDLRRIDLLQALQLFLGYDKQEELNRLAPVSIRVPSGSLVRLQYGPHGEDPVLAVRLQEVFGMLDTPRINNNRKNVVLHLLSPGYKPVQVTSDLRSFWENAYFEVRKELKRRYPKHSWPEEPLKAEAVSGVKRKR